MAAGLPKVAILEITLGIDLYFKEKSAAKQRIAPWRTSKPQLAQAAKRDNKRGKEKSRPALGMTAGYPVGMACELLFLLRQDSASQGVNTLMSNIANFTPGASP